MISFAPLVFGKPLFSRALWKAQSCVFKVPASSFLNAHRLVTMWEPSGLGKPVSFWPKFLHLVCLPICWSKITSVFTLLKRYRKRLPCLFYFPLTPDWFVIVCVFFPVIWDIWQQAVLLFETLLNVVFPSVRSRAAPVSRDAPPVACF